MVKLHAAELVLSPHTPKSSAFIVAVLDTRPVFQGPSKHDAWNPRACWSKLGAWFPQLILSNTIWKDAELTWNDNNNEKTKTVYPYITGCIVHFYGCLRYILLVHISFLTLGFLLSVKPNSGPCSGMGSTKGWVPCFSVFFLLLSFWFICRFCSIVGR